MASLPPEKRVVVTGMGLVTPLGDELELFWQRLTAGVSGIGRITRFDTTHCECRVGAEVKDFDPERFMDPKEARRNDRFAQFAVAAAQKALRDASFSPQGTNEAERLGVVIGSGIGGMETIQVQTGRFHQSETRRVSPFMIPSLICNIASGVVAIEVGAKGPNFSVVTACAAGSHSIGEAFQLLRLGKADVMLAGGSEAPLTELSFAGFCAMKALSTSFNEDPAHACRPFDAKRDGFVMGEGAGVLVLETLAHAQCRGARIYAELVAYEASCDAHHITAPDPEGEGLSLCLRRLLKGANCAPEEVDYINAHGTSTLYNDRSETLSIKRVFGQAARTIPISSTKSMTGHLLGAAGGIEAIATVQSIVSGLIPPTINYEFPDPDCDLNYVPNVALRREVRTALSENLAFGGHNAALLFRRFEDS
ncbi:MAG: beta-ketoacyl-ACP synthase II [Puniceicoccales bacterium]|nr:beta-ketoacyl-ACP synthase II [Puniceicoccales bacterium]